MPIGHLAIVKVFWGAYIILIEYVLMVSFTDISIKKKSIFVLPKLPVWAMQMRYIFSAL